VKALRHPPGMAVCMSTAVRTLHVQVHGCMYSCAEALPKEKAYGFVLVLGMRAAPSCQW
jgi:hypothetical protein